MKRLSLGILMLISIAFCALLNGYSNPISVDDDVGNHFTIVDDANIQLPIFQDQTNVQTGLYKMESRWNYPGSSLSSVPSAVGQPLPSFERDFYIMITEERVVTLENIGYTRYNSQVNTAKTKFQHTDYEGLFRLDIGEQSF